MYTYSIYYIVNAATASVAATMTLAAATTTSLWLTPPQPGLQ
jgi:hypothetical protein